MCQRLVRYLLSGYARDHAHELVQLPHVVLYVLVFPVRGHIQRVDGPLLLKKAGDSLLAIAGNGHHHERAVLVEGQRSHVLEPGDCLYERTRVTRHHVVANREGRVVSAAELDRLCASGVDELWWNLHAVRAHGSHVVRSLHIQPLYIDALQHIEEGLHLIHRSSQVTHTAQVFLRHVHGLSCKALPTSLLALLLCITRIFHDPTSCIPERPSSAWRRRRPSPRR